MIYASLFTSASGIQAASNFLDATSQNVANAETTGYKTAQVTFQDLLYQGRTAGRASPTLLQPTGSQVGSGAVQSALTGVFTQGALQPTGAPLDLAISGNGFFPVALADGTTAFTRAGGFTTDATGRIVNSDGFILATGLTVPADASSVSVGADGTVTAATAAGVQTVGQITLANFQNPQGLQRISDTLFTAGPNSGPAVAGVAGTNGLGTVTQGSLEGANVDLSTELVNLIVAQRAFQSNSRALVAEDAVVSDTLTQLFR